MRTTVNLDDDIYEAARARAQATGKRLGRVLSEMARQALKPGARLIPASRIQKVLDEDDIV